MWTRLEFGGLVCANVQSILSSHFAANEAEYMTYHRLLVLLHAVGSGTGTSGLTRQSDAAFQLPTREEALVKIHTVGSNSVR